MGYWQIFQAIEAFPQIIDDWDRLNHDLYNRHPLLDSRFVHALLKYFGNDTIKLAIYKTQDNKTLNLFLLEQSRLGTWSIFLPSQAQIAPILCSHPESLPNLFKKLAPYSLSLEILSQDPKFSFQISPLSHYEMLIHATTMNINVQGAFNDYWEKRSKNLQKNIKRYFNRLKKNDININIKVHNDKNNLRDALIRYGDMETQSWKGKKGTAIHKNNQQGHFYLNILNSFEKSAQVEIIELYFNQQLVSSRINLSNQEMFIILKTTYDENQAKFSPGRLLLHLLIEREFDLKRISTIEFYTNATADQLSWSTDKREIKHITLYKSSSIKKSFQLIRQLKNRLLNK